MAIVVLLVIAAALGKQFGVLDKLPFVGGTTIQKGGSKQINIPTDWRTLDTTLGFTIKTPATWEVGISATSDINDLKSKTISISDSGADIEINSDSSDESSTSSTGSPDQVTASTQQLAGAKGQSAFEDRVSKLSDSDAKLLEGFGVKKSDVKVSATRLKLNGKELLEVTSNIPGQLSRSLYMWYQDRALAIMVIADTQTKLDKLTDTYLYPMGATIEVKN